jgi:predicted MFS family arabinose efflux permease
VVDQIASSFDVSLAVVGLLSGTLFLGACVAGLLCAAQLGQRIGLRDSARLACALLVAGNLLFAVSPIFAGLAVGRILPGLGFALINTLGAVWARNAGGVRLLGAFGASIQLGLALALLIGSALSDLGLDWRVGFVISAALGAAAFLAIPSTAETEIVPGARSEGFLRTAARHVRVYRLALMFISIFGVPMVLSAWLVTYLVHEGGLSTTLAGVAAFVLFGLSAAARLGGARLQQGGLPHWLLGGTLALAAVGLAGLAFEPIAAVAFAAVVVLAIGFGIPYATALSEAQELYPPAPAEPVALMTLLALLPPIAVVPLVGHALSRGNGETAIWLLAAFLALATLANLRRTGIPLTSPQESPREPAASSP